jgi:hypothetical protein
VRYEQAIAESPTAFQNAGEKPQKLKTPARPKNNRKNKKTGLKKPVFMQPFL